jgi:hypothetical protein
MLRVNAVFCVDSRTRFAYCLQQSDIETKYSEHCSYCVMVEFAA